MGKARFSLPIALCCFYIIDPSGGYAADDARVLALEKAVSDLQARDVEIRSSVASIGKRLQKVESYLKEIDSALATSLQMGIINTDNGMQYYSSIKPLQSEVQTVKQNVMSLARDLNALKAKTESTHRTVVSQDSTTRNKLNSIEQQVNRLYMRR